MVVFTCNHCGDTLHKPKVEKHYQFSCRNYKSVTCVDCFKDFRNEEYVSHTKCITEDERYAAKGTYKNGIVKKGDVKQESWLDMIKSICDTEKNLKPSIRNLLNTISEYSNVPRKKPKFMNFIKSSSGNRANMKEVEEVWDIIEQYKAKNNPNNNNNIQKNSIRKETDDKNGTLESELISKKRSIQSESIEEESPKKKKKKSQDKTESEFDQDNVEITKKKSKKAQLEPFQGTEIIFAEGNQNNESDKVEASKKKKNRQNNLGSSKEDSLETSETIEDAKESLKFNFKEKILEILAEKPSISHKKLQKKILKAYVSATGESDCDEKVIKKLNKKLKKLPNVGVVDDKVVLQ